MRYLMLVDGAQPGQAFECAGAALDSARESLSSAGSTAEVRDVWAREILWAIRLEADGSFTDLPF